MQCDMCGGEFSTLILTKIEGTKLNACKNCSKFGQTIKLVKTVSPKEIKRKEKIQFQQREEKVEKIIADYSSKIRKAREKLNIKQEDFAKKINEKESLVQHMETGKQMPSIKLAKKLESMFHIKLIEIEEPESLLDKVQASTESSQTLTLGDMIKIKKRK